MGGETFAYRRWAGWLGVALILGWALPLFVPPPPLGLVDAPDGAGLWQRVFAGVPAEWMAARLLALALGLALVIWATGASASPPRHVPEATAHLAGPRSAALRRAALALGAANLAAALLLGRLGRLGEAVYFFLPVVPIALLAADERDVLRGFVGRHRRALSALLVVPGLWLAATLVLTWRDPLAATLVDTWIAVSRLEKLASGEWKALVDSAIPGVTNAYLLLEGATLLGLLGRPVTFEWLQVVHGAWMAAAAVACGLLAWRVRGIPAALVAQAALLCSPFALSFAYDPLSRYILLVPVALLLLLLHTLRTTRSASAFVAFAVVAAFCLTTPHLVPLALFVGAIALVAVRRRPRPPRPTLAIAALCAGAVLVPAIPGPETFGAMAEQYTKGTARMAEITRILFGQRSLSESTAAMEGGEPRPADVALGALLTPVATARTPLRLIGDVALDPVGAVLLLVGLVWCLRHVRHPPAWVLLGVVAAGMAPAFVASGDQVSHTRLSPALVPMALLAALGFEALADAPGGGRRRTVLAAWAAGAIAAGGFTVVFLVNPRILPSSWLTVVVEAAGEPAAGRQPVVLEYGIGESRIDWLNVESIARLLPAEPLAVRTYSERDVSALARPDAGARLYFFSPALDGEAAVARALCERWPGTRLYTLHDRTGFTEALAADPAGGGWVPALPRDRWSAAGCA